MDDYSNELPFIPLNDQEVQHLENELYRKHFASNQILDEIKSLKSQISWRKDMISSNDCSEAVKLEYQLEIDVLSELILYLYKFK